MNSHSVFFIALTGRNKGVGDKSQSLSFATDPFITSAVGRSGFREKGV